jgi:long-chain-fatty-acid--CoA ligase ACSBG
LQGAKAADTPWTTWTWKEYRGEVDAFAKALLSLGVSKFDMINIIGFNAPEWLFANYGAIAAGCVPAGVYATNRPDACKYIGSHSKAKIVVVEGVKQLEKYYEISKDLPDLKALVVYGGDELPADIKAKCSVPCYTYSDFVKIGKDDTSLDALLKERSSSWKPGETCTLIYSTFRCRESL